MPYGWHDDLQMTVTGGGTGTLTLGSAVSGFQAFAAGDDGLPFSFGIKDGTAFESNEGVYTHSSKTLTRVAFGESSTGSALNVSTSATVFVDITSPVARSMHAAAQGQIPGGRLTLTSGVPVTTSDVTGATTVYYTPYNGNAISLWDGNRWADIIFAEVSLALGTLTNGVCYDVFGFLSAGTLNTELLAWMNNTTRATAITLQDGRYCKSGNKTRLYLGTFITTSTTTTEDSGGGITTQVGGIRGVWNMYNRVRRFIGVIDTTSQWSYTSFWRLVNGASNLVYFVIGVAEDVVLCDVRASCYVSQSTSVACAGIGLDSIAVPTGLRQAAYVSGTAVANYSALNAYYQGYPGIGRHYLSWLEQGGTNASGSTIFVGANSGDGQQTGLVATVFA